MNNFNLENKTVLITGASRGIGFGIAEAFAKQKVDLFILSNENDIFEAQKKLSMLSKKKVKSFKCDISNKNNVKKIISEIDNLDILINNAGLEKPTPITDLDNQIDSNFERIIEINVLGTYYVTRYFLPKMSRGGSIIITSSIWGKIAVANFSAYCASKHANIGFMRSLSKELGPLGIRVNAVCPGWVETTAAMNSLNWMSTKFNLDKKDLLNDIISSQSIEGLMKPVDASQLYLYLASSFSSNITGQAINIDRGEVLG